MTETVTEEKPTVEQSNQVKDSSESKEVAPNSLPNSPNSAVTNVTLGKSGTASVWVNLDKLKVFKAAVKLQGTTSLSDELNQFFEKRTAEIRGLIPVGDPNSFEAEVARRQGYELAKKRVFELHSDIARMKKFLKDSSAWTDFLAVFCKYVDYGRKFDPSGSADAEESNGYDNYCIRFIEQASDREAEFKREVARFLLRNKGNEFAFTWIGFVEKLAERRKLTRQMLMFQMDSLGEQEISKLEEEEREHKAEKVKEENASESPCNEDDEDEENETFEIVPVRHG